MSVKKTKRVLVIGSTGQIGSELTVDLRKRFGKENVVATGHSRRPEGALQDGPFELLDALNKADMINLLKRYDIDTIYHLAGILSAVGEQKPALAWEVNVNGLRNVLEVALENGLRVFWPSSIATFGSETPQIMTPQNTVLMPRTIYGVTKVAGELLSNYYANRYGLDVRGIRIPGVVSSETLPGGGTTDYAVEMFYEAIKKKRYTCYLKEDAALPMIYMPDCDKAIIDLMEADSSKISCRMGYNVGSMSFSPRELVDEIKKYIPEFICEYKPDFRQAIADSWPISIDDTVARKDWSWKPSYDLALMTKDMIEKISQRIQGK